MVVKRMHRERSKLCHLKKRDFNKWLALSPVRHSGMAEWVKLAQWWRTEGESDGAHP